MEQEYRIALPPEKLTGFFSTQNKTSQLFVTHAHLFYLRDSDCIMKQLFLKTLNKMFQHLSLPSSFLSTEQVSIDHVLHVPRENAKGEASIVSALKALS